MSFSDISKLPDNPGCYQFLDKNDKIIYIGKAKNLKKRIASYFSKTKKDIKTEFLVKKIMNVEFIVTDTESEAFLLEANLIKRHQPKYNINLKDSKRYAFILLTKEQFPRLVVSRQRDKKGEYFGPFVSAEKRDMIIKLARMMFHIRTCKRLPKRACLRYHIGLCDAPCIKNVSKEDYDKNITKTKEFLKGNIEELFALLEKQMKEHSDKTEFEKAKIARDKLFALKSLRERQRTEKMLKYDQDIFAYIEKKEKTIFNVFNVSRGVLLNKQEFEFGKVPDPLEQMLTRYYEDNPVPKEVIIQEQLTDDTVAGYLQEKRSDKVIITVPLRGEKKKLIDMVRKNIFVKENRNEIALESLRKSLKLQETPNVVECFDISHIQGSDTVASMVQFRGGQPDKGNYRKFKIKTVIDVNDFASIAEVVHRRYKRLAEDGKQMPDLIVVDGGKGQLSSAIYEIRKLGLNIPTISLAKKQEEVFVPYLRFPLNIRKDSEGSKLLQRLRDEAHRFAITYHRTLRKKRIRK